jgi:hypothetical protein
MMQHMPVAQPARPRAIIDTSVAAPRRFIEHTMPPHIARLPRSDHSLSTTEITETPEERRLRLRIEMLRSDIAAAAAELEELRALLGAFEARYDARVGVLIVELDRANLDVAKLTRKIEVLKSSPVTPNDIDDMVEQEFASEQARLDAELHEAQGARVRAARLPDPPPPDISRSLREQYRRLARKFHPDVAVTDEQRMYNEAAMKRINEAMGSNDIDMLSVLEASLPAGTAEMPGGSSRARIRWATGEISRLEQVRIRTVGQVAAVKASSIYELWARAERDPAIIERLAREISDELTVVRIELRTSENEYRRLLRPHAPTGLG